MLVGGGLTLLTAPVLAARLAEFYVSHHFGGDLGSYRFDIGWFWSVPQVYVLVVPAAGVALDRAGRSPPPLPPARRWRCSSSGCSASSASARGHSSADVRRPALRRHRHRAVLPALALLGLLADTLRGGRPASKAPLLFAMGTLLMLLLGAVAGALLVIDPLDLHGTVWEAGQMHLLLLGAGTLGGLGALWWWAPKLWGAGSRKAPGCSRSWPCSSARCCSPCPISSTAWRTTSCSASRDSTTAGRSRRSTASAPPAASS